MQRFHARGVELDQCTRCAGVWLDGGELDEVLGRALASAPMGRPGSGRRRCARCGGDLSAVRLEGQVDAEHCPKCRGLFLDDGELTRLSLADGAAASAPELLFFYCVGCGRRGALADGRTTPEGLACPQCAPRLRGAAPEEREPPRAPGLGGLLRRLLG